MHSAMNPQWAQEPDPQKPGDLDPAADQLPATRQNWPGRSEPGHIRRIGPARRPEDTADKAKEPRPEAPSR
ncbi:hypothetical protein [Silvibacterium sp.]|uniref:hypothetical protein n=1 Tax=Silvibacterium sp. TaxID=1964179 RepID=UPI0039E60D34